MIKKARMLLAQARAALRRSPELQWQRGCVAAMAMRSYPDTLDAGALAESLEDPDFKSGYDWGMQMPFHYRVPTKSEAPKVRGKK